MDIYLDYETVCVNCKEKGYSFGYSIKTIEYKHQLVLDIPQNYLNGPCLYFQYRNHPIFIRSLENSHKKGYSEKKPVFSMINAKHSQNDTISRFTYVFYPNHLSQIQLNQPVDMEDQHQIYEYVDIYRFVDKPYMFFFYSFRNSTPFPLNGLKFYNLLDFDIFGSDHFDSDRASFDTATGVIYQFDSNGKGDLYAGFGSISQNRPTHFECNRGNELMVSIDRLNLRDMDNFGPDDCAVGLQWDIPTLQPQEYAVFPIMLVVANSKEEFFKHVNEARIHLEKLVPSVNKGIRIKSRQEIDSRLENLSFSTQKWCKD